VARWDDAGDETGSFYLDEETTTASGPGGKAAGPVRQTPSAQPREGEQVTVSGIVRGKSERSEQERVQYPDGHWGEASLTVVSFRVDEFDGAGNRVRSVPVEMRGTAYTGHLTDGDTISAQGTSYGGVVHCTEIVDAASGARFTATDQNAQESKRPLPIRIALGAFVVFVVVFLVIVFAILGASIFGFRLPGGIGGTGSDGPGSTPSSVVKAIPNVVGENNVNAATLLDDAGFHHYLFEDVKGPSSRFGRVLRTTPTAGTKVSTSTQIRIYIGSV
jgi:hypothetical protein